MAGGERERADRQRGEAEAQGRERRDHAEETRLDAVERQGVRFGGGDWMAAARAEAGSRWKRMGAAGARVRIGRHVQAFPGARQLESGDSALRGSCYALREPPGSLRLPPLVRRLRRRTDTFGVGP